MPQPLAKHSKQIVGNTGLYHVCFRLSQLGWNVMPTARNAKGIDVVAYDGTGRNFVGVQVKSLSKRAVVSVGTSDKSILGDFWLVVVGVASTPKTYIIPSRDIRKLMHRTEKDRKSAYWIEPRDFEKS